MDWPALLLIILIIFTLFFYIIIENRIYKKKLLAVINVFETDINSVRTSITQFDKKIESLKIKEKTIKKKS